MSAKYWNKTGKYSQLLDEKWNELVPDLGEAKTEIGELIRSFGRINYEMFNNGCCNMFDAKYDEDDHVVSMKLDKFYFHLFNNLSFALDNITVSNGYLITELETECRSLFKNSDFNKENWKIDEVGDRVGEIVENYFLNK